MRLKLLPLPHKSGLVVWTVNAQETEPRLVPVPGFWVDIVWMVGWVD